MKTIIEKSKYLSLVIIVTMLLTFALAVVWGVGKAVSAWTVLISSYGKSPTISLLLINIIDSFLIAVVLYFLAASIYNLFIGKLDLPPQLVANNLSELKTRLGGIIVLVIVVRFMEVIFAGDIAAIDVMWLALATALVGGMLIAFGYFTSKAEVEE